MEIELEGRSRTTRIPVEASTAAEIGRNLNIFSDDRTISRRHLVVRPHHSPASQKGETPDLDGEIELFFEVTGKNPIFVAEGNGGEKMRMFRSGEKGVMREGDRLSVSIGKPRFFRVKMVRCKEKEEVDDGVLDAVKRREERKVEEEKRCSDGKDGGGKRRFGFELLDFSQIDPVKEFGFLVRGHEFDHYPGQKIRPVKDWNWNLDESNVASSDEEKEKIRKRRKTEDDNELVTSYQTAKSSKYSTRSKDSMKQEKDEKDDESLGGFIDIHCEQEEEEEEEEEDDDDEEEEEEEEFDSEDD